MEIDLEDICVVRVKLNNKELQDLVQGERLVVDIDNNLQLEIYHAPMLNYSNPKQHLNGEDHE